MTVVIPVMVLVVALTKMGSWAAFSSIFQARAATAGGLLSTTLQCLSALSTALLVLISSLLQLVSLLRTAFLLSCHFFHLNMLLSLLVCLCCSSSISCNLRLITPSSAVTAVQFHRSSRNFRTALSIFYSYSSG